MADENAKQNPPTSQDDNPADDSLQQSNQPENQTVPVEVSSPDPQGSSKPKNSQNLPDKGESTGSTKPTDAPNPADNAEDTGSSKKETDSKNKPEILVFSRKPRNFIKEEVRGKSTPLPLYQPYFYPKIEKQLLIPPPLTPPRPRVKVAPQPKKPKKLPPQLTKKVKQQMEILKAGLKKAEDDEREEKKRKEEHKKKILGTFELVARSDNKITPTPKSKAMEKLGKERWEKYKEDQIKEEVFRKGKFERPPGKKVPPESTTESKYAAQIEAKRKKRERERRAKILAAEERIGAIKKDAEILRKQREDERNKRRNEIDPKLLKYVEKMAYHPDLPPPRKKRVELSDPLKRTLLDNYDQFKQVLVPKQRGERLERQIEQFKAITTEKLEEIIKSEKAKRTKKEDVQRRKQELYYELMARLQKQCRQQYLDVLVEKFADFIAKLATKMTIPAQLIEPYSRMQRSLFCNIMGAIKLTPLSQLSIDYTTKEAHDFQNIHRIAHALLSLIIKGLDMAANKDPNEVKHVLENDDDLEMDNYIKERLMCAVDKKIVNERAKNKTSPIISSPSSPIKKCQFYLDS